MSQVIVSHDEACPPRNRTTLGGHSDASKRTSDEYQLHRIGRPDAIGHWFAVRLSDGTSDHVLYSLRREAVRHQRHDEMWYAFLQIRPSGLSICEAASFLRTARMAYDAGFRLTDPEHRSGGRQLITRLGLEDQRRADYALENRMWIPGRNPR